jgi:hypothetical protein
MSGYATNIEKKVSDLNALGYKKFYKQRGYINAPKGRIFISNENNPKLKWDEGDELPVYCTEFWILYYFNGAEYLEIWIPPSDVPYENSDEWGRKISRHSWEKGKARTEEEWDEYDSESQYGAKEKIERAQVHYKTVQRNEFDQILGASYPAILLENILRWSGEMELADPDKYWEMIHMAFTAGKEAQMRDSIESYEIAKKAAPLIEQQSKKRRKAKSEWTNHVRTLFVGNPKISAKEVAISLKERGLCDFNFWGDDIEFFDGTSAKNQTAFRNSVTRIKGDISKTS